MNSSWKCLIAMAVGLLAVSVRADEVVGLAARRPYRPPPLRPGEVSRTLDKQEGPAIVLQRPLAVPAVSPAAEPPASVWATATGPAEPRQLPARSVPDEPGFVIRNVAPGTVLATTGNHSPEFTARVGTQSTEVGTDWQHHELPPTADYSNRMFRWHQAYRDQGPENAGRPLQGGSTLATGEPAPAPRRLQGQPGPSPGNVVIATRAEEVRSIARSVSKAPELFPLLDAPTAPRVNETALPADSPPPNGFRRVPLYLSDLDGTVVTPVVQTEEQTLYDVPTFDRFYGRAEYLLWWVKGSPLPPLATTAPFDSLTFVPNPTGIYTGDRANMSGALSGPGSVVVLGDDRVGRGARSGGRVQLGCWVLDEHLLGFEAEGFILGQQRDRASVNALGDVLLARPVRDALANWAEASVAHLLPPNHSGNIGYVQDSTLWGVQVNGRTCLQATDRYFIDLLAGYRTVGLNESLTITEVSVQAGTPQVSTATSSSYIDHFGVNNQFHGGQFGAEAGLLLGRWSLEAKTRLALGYTVQELNIYGQSGNGPVGILAAVSNIGHYQRAVFSAMPEVGFTVGYQVTDWMRAYLGYDLLYWSSVLRPGNQIDRVVNLNQVLTVGFPARPSAVFNASDFWAQGIHLGLELRY